MIKVSMKVSIIDVNHQSCSHVCNYIWRSGSGGSSGRSHHCDMIEPNSDTMSQIKNEA